MSDQPRPSHELFHDVTDTRPRAGRAAGGTLAVSILAHALILAAVIVVPLLATDTLPTLVDSVGVFRPVEPPPPDPPAPAIKRTTAAPQPNEQNRAPVEPPDEIVDEQPRGVVRRVRRLCRGSDRGPRHHRRRSAAPATVSRSPRPRRRPSRRSRCG